MEIKKIIYIDMDGVLANIAKQHSKKLEENPKMIYPQATYGYFIEMEEIDGAINAVKALSEHFDVWFLSAPSWKNPLCLAEKCYWIQKHFGLHWAEKLILSSNKGLLKGDYLIDDNITGRGQDLFTGELIHFGSIDFNNWVKVFDYVLDKEKLL